MRDVKNLIEDWSSVHQFRVESPPEVRIKGVPRLLEKLERKDVDDPAALLSAPYPVRDLVGARIIVRGVNDYEAIHAALEANLLPWEISNIDDKRAKPTKTGYRALHLDCLLPVTVRGDRQLIPIELQVKTLAQKIWGEYTHDSAYAMGAVANDARFQVIRSLQETLAGHLELVDVLQGTIERVSADLVVDIAGAPATDEVSVASVLNLFFTESDMVVRLAQAQDIVELCRYIGIGDIGVVRPLLATDSEEASAIADGWRAANGGRSPTPPELVAELLRAALPQPLTGYASDE